MSKVPRDPAGGNLRFSKHQRVACVVAMDTSVLSLGYFGPTPLPLKASVPKLINRVTIGPGPKVSVCGCAH